MMTFSVLLLCTCVTMATLSSYVITPVTADEAYDSAAATNW